MRNRIEERTIEDRIESRKNPNIVKDRYDEYFDLVFKHKLYFTIIPHWSRFRLIKKSAL